MLVYRNETKTDDTVPHGKGQKDLFGMPHASYITNHRTTQDNDGARGEKRYGTAETH